MLRSSYFSDASVASRLGSYLDLIDVTPAPILSRLDGLHDRMLGAMKMFCRMLVLG
jgi:hypothetical protein